MKVKPIVTSEQAYAWQSVVAELDQQAPEWQTWEGWPSDRACAAIRYLAQGAKRFDELHAAHSKVAKELEEAVDILECLRDDPECSYRTMIGTFLAKLRE